MKYTLLFTAALTALASSASAFAVPGAMADTPTGSAALSELIGTQSLSADLARPEATLSLIAALGDVPVSGK